jgi:archaellum component FlaC
MVDRLDKFDIILEEILFLKQETIMLRKEIEEIKSSTHKMDSHIDFVESIYERVKKPFNYVMDKLATKERAILDGDAPQYQ